MRFAEEMLLNAKMYGLAPYTRRGVNNNRCALGLVGEDSMDGFGAELAYKEMNLVPCSCAPESIPLILGACVVVEGKTVYTQASAAVIHLFNEHVMQGKRQSPNAEPWTFERLADWIDSVDPTPREVAEQPTDLQTFLEAVNTKA